MSTSPRLAGVYVYPVKSTAAIAVEDCEVESRGITGDRRWLVVDARGDFLTGRDFPNLVQVRAVQSRNGLSLSAPGMPELAVPTPDATRQRLPVMVWNDCCQALPASHEAGSWLSKFLGIDCRLAYMDAECTRPLSGTRGLADDQVSFADNYPLLGISVASVDDVSHRASEPMDMRRFRPNLVFDNCAAYVEDGWRRLSIGEVEFDGVERCSRCGMTIIDPDTAERHPAQEPLKTLSQYRRGSDGAVYLGRSLIPRSRGTVRVGDRITVHR